MLNGCQMNRIQSYKYLGVQITSDLMWSDHIVKICNKTKKLIGILYPYNAISINYVGVVTITSLRLSSAAFQFCLNYLKCSPHKSAIQVMVAAPMQ